MMTSAPEVPTTVGTTDDSRRVSTLLGLLFGLAGMVLAASVESTRASSTWMKSNSLLKPRRPSSSVVRSENRLQNCAELAKSRALGGNGTISASAAIKALIVT